MNIKAKPFITAISEVSKARGISEDSVKEALVEAFNESLIRLLRGPKKVYKGTDDEGNLIEYEDAKVETEIGKTEIKFFQIKTVMEEDDIQDDVFDIELEEAKEYNPKAKIGDEVKIPLEIQENELVAFMNSVKIYLKNALEKEEKKVLFDNYREKIGTLITGTIERVEDRSITVVLTAEGKQTLVVVPRRDLIGDENFKVHESVTFYVDEEERRDNKGKTNAAGIKITRASEGFLRKVLEEEIPEIEEGLIEIKKISRDAGRRSKVAVWSKDVDIDASGAVIGKSGSRINAIMHRLGNGHMNERIDVLNYSPNLEAFIARSLVPGQVLGMTFVKTEEGKDKAIVVVKEEEYKNTIGFKALNIKLASRLTGVPIEVKKENIALGENITYKPIDVINEEEKQRIDIIRKEEFARKTAEYKEAQEEQAFVSPTKITESVENRLSEDGFGKIYDNKPKEKPQNTVENKEKKNDSKPKNFDDKEVVNVQTTTTLDSLEKALDVKVPEDVKTHYTNAKKPRQIMDDEIPYTEEEKKEDTTQKTQPIPAMSIYTEEELRELENEEENNEVDIDDNDDIDFDNYDDYYDDEDN